MTQDRDQPTARAERASQRFQQELENLRQTRDQILDAHESAISLAGSDVDLTDDQVDDLCQSLSIARVLTEDMQSLRIPTTDEAWSEVSNTLGDEIPQSLTAAARRPWLLIPRQLEQLETDRQDALEALAKSWRRSMELLARETVGPPCTALINAMARLGRTEPKDRPALYVKLSADSLIQMTNRENETWAVAWSGKADACRLDEFAAPSAGMLVDRFRQTRIEIAEATAHAQKIQVAVGSDALLADASLQLQSLESELSEALEALAASAPSARLQLLTSLQLDDLIDSLDSQADEWLDHWLAEVNERKSRGLAGEAATALRDSLHAGAEQAAALCSYARAVKKSALPAGTYAVSEDGSALVNTPRAPKWIELHPFGWNQPLPPFPSDWRELKRTLKQL
jgi:hypothetical protein